MALAFVTYMNNHLPPFRCADDLPEDVSERINLLYEKERQLLDLEAQMHILCAERDKLRIELSRYLVSEEIGTNGSSIALYARTGPVILRCPDEVLEMVFSLYLHPCHTHIRTLLLVCKRFNHIIENSAKFWSRIQILDARYLFNRIAEPSSELYISTCMKRSQDLPINVELHFYEFPHSEATYLSTVASSFTNIIGHEDAFSEMIYQLHDGWWDSDPTSYMKEADNALRILTGPEDVYLQRWNTLSITLPEDDTMANYVWGKLDAATSNLTTVKIYGYPENWINEAEDSDTYFPKLSSAKRLRLPLGRSLFDFKVSPDILQHLEMEISTVINVLQEISAFHALETLRLHVTEIGLPNSPKFAIHLPSLKELGLSGYYRFITHLDFDFPNLKLLSLNGDVSHHVVPQISPHHLRWMAPSFKNHTMEGFPLNSLLLTYPMIQTLTIPAIFKQEAIMIIAKCEAEEGASQLTRLKLEYENGYIECLELSEALLALREVHAQPETQQTSIQSRFHPMASEFNEERDGDLY